MLNVQILSSIIAFISICFVIYFRQHVIKLTSSEEMKMADIHKRLKMRDHINQ